MNAPASALQWGVTRGYLVFDLETVPDPDLAWDAAKDGFPPPLYHEVVALGALLLDGDLRFKRLGVFGVPHAGEGHVVSEAAVLDDFAAFVGKARPHLVTYNGRGFDLPVLVNRCLKHGVPFTIYYADRDYRYRYSDLGHIDLADLLSDHGAARKPRLDAVAHLVGLPGKLGVDGSMVESMHAEGRIEEIRAYCLEDVVQTAFVFLRTELLRGRLDRAAYRERARLLWDGLAADPRVRIRPRRRRPEPPVARGRGRAGGGARRGAGGSWRAQPPAVVLLAAASGGARVLSMGAPSRAPPPRPAPVEGASLPRLRPPCPELRRARGRR